MAHWTTPRARRVFGTTAEFAQASDVLAANLGFYNAFLGAGLLIGLWLGAAGQVLVIYFLLCVATACLFGAVTATRSAVHTQTIPASLVRMAVWLGV